MMLHAHPTFIGDQLKFAYEDPGLVDFTTYHASRDLEWRDGTSNLKARLYSALDTEYMTDVVLQVGPEGTPLKCHSIILCLYSSVFSKKLCTTLSTTTRTVFTHQIQFPNYRPETFKKFLVFLYTEKLEATVEEALELLDLGRDFEIEILIHHCIALIQDQVDISNSAFIYDKAIGNNEPALASSVQAYIIRNAAEVFETPAFLGISLACLKSLLNSTSNNLDQLFSFNAMIRWGKECCVRKELDVTPLNIRHVLDTSLQLINYDRMSITDFCEYVVESEVLPEKEGLHILKNMNLSIRCAESRVGIPLTNQKFERMTSTTSSYSSGISVTSSDSEKIQDITTSTINISTTSSNFRLNRYSSIGSANLEWKDGGLEKLRFTSSKALNLRGVGFWARSFSTEAEIKASLILSSIDEVVQLGSVRRIFPKSTDGGFIEILFDVPVQLIAKEWYTLKLNLSGQVGLTSTIDRPLHKKLHLQLNKKDKITFKFKYPKGINEKGQFRELILCRNN